MTVMDSNKSEPISNVPHSSSWFLHNQLAPPNLPTSSSAPIPQPLPLASSNSLTGISSQHPLPSSTPLRTSSSSTVHQSSHPSRATSDVYPSQHPSAPRDSPLALPSRLNNQPVLATFNINNTGNTGSNNNLNNTHSTSHTKFGNLLNVSNVAVEFDRNQNRMGLERSSSNQGESYSNHQSHLYAHPSHSLSVPIDYRSHNPAYPDHQHLKHPDSTPLDRHELYQPMHRPHFPSHPYSQAPDVHNQDHLHVHHANSYHNNYYEQPANSYHNNSSPPYPGNAPMPIYKERTYGIPKYTSTGTGSPVDEARHLEGSLLPSFKPMPHDIKQTSEREQTGSQTPSANSSSMQPSSAMEIRDLAIGCISLRETIQAFQAKGMNQERAEFLQDYIDLMKAYEEKCDTVYDSTEKVCMNLILKSRVPLLEDTITAPVDDETPEDARQKLVVKKKFVDAMEVLQGDQLPTKRRGNLPKDCTDVMKRWFDSHYDYPYPTDEEKLEMSRITKIGITQISHWFINYRKRVWKPSLPPGHPALNGDHMKKPRKKQKTGKSAGD